MVTCAIIHYMYSVDLHLRELERPIFWNLTSLVHLDFDNDQHGNDE